MRRLFIILGLVLGIIVAAGVFLFLQVSRPVTYEIPVAADDIPAGTVLHADMFRVARLANVDAETLQKWITAAEWSKADGKVITSDIRAGFPVAKAQIDPNSSAAQETRLSLALGGPDEYYVVIPASPNDVGNFIQPGDRIDLMLSLGDASNKEVVAVVQPNQNQNPNSLEPQIVISETAPMPMSKLIMQNMTVLRVEREAARTQNTSQQSQAQVATLGNVQRLYVKVNRDQLEVLSFVLNNGKHNFAVRAANGNANTVPVNGVTWEDFVKWFYAQRANVNGDPFNATSPVTPKDGK
jgi:Flp pilus assembly protein CpaB